MDVLIGYNEMELSSFDQVSFKVHKQHKQYNIPHDTSEDAHILGIAGTPSVLLQSNNIVKSSYQNLSRYLNIIAAPNWKHWWWANQRQLVQKL